MCACALIVCLAACLQVPGCREPSAQRVTAYRIAVMLHPKQFSQHVLQRCESPQLRGLLSDLHSLFFRESAGEHTYVKTVSPASFKEVCQDHLDRISQRRQRGSAKSSGSPPAGTTDPA